MIQYALECENSHRFDAWFRNAATFEEQREAEIVTCPVCQSFKVEKALMAPAVSRPSTDKMAVASGQPDPKKLRAAIRQFRQMVETNNDFVGERFAEEARKMHFGEIDQRGIYGEASREEVVSLLEDGIDILPLPKFPDDHN